MDWTTALPLIFAALMAFSLFVYAILDGYDLGVGLLLPFTSDHDSDTLLASIGPFWDANETWLVLGIGLMLIAFPEAHGIILGELYLPVTVLLVGLILRGVAFDFRAKVPTAHKLIWDRLFFIGSLLATTSQGYMLGTYVLGFNESTAAIGFALLSAVCVAMGYAFIGGAWLIMKTDGDLQRRCVRWTRIALRFMMLGIVAVSIVNPLVSDAMFEKWFTMPQAIMLAPIPIICAATALGTHYYLGHFKAERAVGNWLPFASAVLMFLLCFQGLAYSFYPEIVPGQLTIWDAAAATESLAFMAVGVAIVFPAIIGYTLVSYRVFWGKATELTYY
ncbi:MAG: cytochrome d ubiquinol oxidase subunit II [Pseudomonadota bacterium]